MHGVMQALAVCLSSPRCRPCLTLPQNDSYLHALLYLPYMHKFYGMYVCFANAPSVRIFEKPYFALGFCEPVGYHYSNHTATGEVLVHLTSDLLRYCCFGETLLMLSQVVDSPTM